MSAQVQSIAGFGVGVGSGFCLVYLADFCTSHISYAFNLNIVKTVETQEPEVPKDNQKTAKYSLGDDMGQPQGYLEVQGQGGFQKACFVESSCLCLCGRLFRYPKQPRNIEALKQRLDELGPPLPLAFARGAPLGGILNLGGRASGRAGRTLEEFTANRDTIFSVLLLRDPTKLYGCMGFTQSERQTDSVLGLLERA